MPGRRMRWWPAVAVVPMAAALFALGGGVAARAAIPVTKVGWWTKSPSPAGPPQGGIEVGAAPDGNLSVAALEIDAGGGASGAKLTLTESGGQAQQAATLQACPTSDSWASATGGALTDAPRAQCPTTPYALTRDSSGNWTIDLTPLLAGKTGPTSVMIVPGPPPAALPGGAQPAAFQVAFNPPTVDGTTLPATDTSSGSSSLSSGNDTSTSPADVSSTYSTVPSYSVASSPAYSGGTGITPSAVLPATPTTAAPVAATGAPASAAPSVNPAGGGQVAFPIRAAGTRAKPTSRGSIVAFLGLSLLVGVGAGGWHWARGEGILERLIPAGRGRSLLPPA